MSKWRPKNWWTMVESPYMHDGVKMAKENPERALELELQHQAFRGGQEAGADAMLEAITEEIQKHGRIKSYWVKTGSKKRKKELTRLTIADMEQAHDIGGIIEIASKRAAQAQLDKILALLK